MEMLRVKNDINGNGRIVVHYLAFIRPDDPGQPGRYELALSRARKMGGRKFHNKQFGGGIVFQAYSEHELERDILKFMAGPANL